MRNIHSSIERTVDGGDVSTRRKNDPICNVSFVKGSNISSNITSGNFFFTNQIGGSYCDTSRQKESS